MTKRIVLQETQGPRAGLHHIMGTDDELGGAELPDFVEVVEIMERISAASLVSVGPRWVLYREVLKDGTGESPQDKEMV
jgi:hypothetical protein